MVVYAYSPRCQDTEAKRLLQVQGLPRLHSKFQAVQCSTEGGDGVLKIAQEAFGSTFVAFIFPQSGKCSSASHSPGSAVSPSACRCFITGVTFLWELGFSLVMRCLSGQILSPIQKCQLLSSLFINQKENHLLGLKDN